MKQNKFATFIFFTPETHKITNSFSRSCFIINIRREIKNANGINFVKIPKRFKKEYWKYVITEYPFSTIKSKKFTALTVHAMADKPNRIIKKVLIISLIKF